MQKLSFQKHPIHNLFTTILLLGGGLFAAAGLTSCDNFLNGGDVRQEIEDAIAYNNAKEITVLIQPEEGTGTTVPAGNHKAKQGYDFEVSFSENPAYSFVKWVAVSKDKPQEIITDGISFEDAKSPKTKVKVSSDSTSIRIIPFCEQRIAVSGEPSPRYDPLGVSRDRSISVSFTKPLAESSFIFAEKEIPEGASVKKDENGKIWAYTLNGETFLKNISITNIDDYSIAEYFTKPEVNGKLLTIAVDKNNPIEFNAGEIFKTVKVTLSKDIEDSGHIKMNSQKSWNYQITEATDEKATVILTSTEAEGSVYLASTKSYSLGQKITLAFTENADYQFVRWDYDSSIIYIEDPKSLNTVAVVREKTTEEAPTQIKAVCAPRLRVTKLLPENDNANPTVSKNSPIVITFNHEIPADENSLPQLENITISVGGAPVKSSFKSPVISGNTITFDADNYNMLEVPAGQTKTVSVSIPADFYYQLEDGTKITYGGNGRTYDYKIDDSTKQKAAITFTSTGESGAITPAAGLGRYSIGQEIPLNFTPASGWKFVSWTILKNNAPLDESKIKIADQYSPDTKLIVYESLEGVTVKANASKILAVTATTPSSETNSKNSAITIIFNEELDASCKDLLNQIKISMDSVNVDSYFTERKLSTNKITISQNPEKYLNVTGTEKKTVTVTVPATLFYTDIANNTKIFLPQEYSFSYVVDSTTDKKTSIAYEVSTINSGTINYGTTNAYDIGSTVNLSFSLGEDYQFNGWQITDENGNKPDESVIKIADEKAPATTMTVYQYAEGLSVKASASKKLKIETYTPTASLNVKDSDITITFNKNLSFENPVECQALLSSIRVNMEGNSVDNLFTRKAEGNVITLTNIKYLSVADGLQKTVTVTVPATFYYMDGSVKVNLEQEKTFNYVVNSSSEAKAVISFEASASTGSVSQSPVAGVDGYSLDKEISIVFTPDNNCEFTGWTVTDSAGNSVPASKIKIEDSSEKSTKLHIYESVSNVTVKANAKLMPVVSSFEPNYESSGKECDTPIEVKFNKQMKTDTFKLYSDTTAEGRKGTIQIVNPSNEYEHYEEYFNEPAWSADGKTLTLKPKNTIRDALVKNDTDLRNIRIVFDISKVSDTDGNRLKEADASWVYRINHSMETIAPTVEMKLYKRGFELSQNENGKYFAKENGEYTELSDLAFSQFVTDTYPLNHVGKNIYFDAYVFDEGSGYNNLTIKETLIKTTADNDVNAQTYYYETSFSKETDSFNDSINTDSVILYSLQSTIDGLVRLDFVFEDFAHSSTVVTYYVIKDTQLNKNVYQKDSASQEYTLVYGTPDAIVDPQRSTFMYRRFADSETAATRRFCNEDNTFNEVIKFSNQDEYYKISNENKYTSYAHYNVFWGYDENDICNEAEESSERTFSFTRDVTDDCFIRITVFDDAGNFFTDTAKIPKQHTVAGLKENQFSNGIKYYTPKTTFSSSYTDYYIFYRYKANEASELSEFTRHIMRSSTDFNSSQTQMGFQLANPLFTDETYTPDGIYYIYDLPYNTSPFGEIEGTMSKPFVLYHNCEGSTSTDAPAFPDDFTCEINPAVPDSTGKRQVSVSLPETFVKTQGCYYGVTYGSGENFYDFNFTVNSGSYHDIYLCAMDSEGTFYKSNICKTVNASYDNTPPKMQEISEAFCYKDLSSPNEIVLTQKKDGYNNQSWHKIYLPIDYGGSGLYEKEKDIYEFDYYLKKRDDTEITQLNLSREDLEGLEKHTVSYPKTAKQIKLNFNEPVESYYVLILDLKDKNTNYALVNCTVSNIIVPFYPDFYLEGNSTSDYSIKIDNLKINKISYYFDCCTLSDTEWTFKKRYIQGSDDAMKTCSFSNETVPFVRCGLNGPSNSFYKFICPEYWIKKNAGNSTECNSKSVIPGLGGAYQVYYDSPCFAHTLVYPTDMLGDLDAKLAEAKAIDPTVDDETYIKAIWETKGREYGLKLINSAWLDNTSTSTYTAPVSEIPSGYSYVTIFHFADGTSVMSEVKQKQ